MLGSVRCIQILLAVKSRSGKLANRAQPSSTDGSGGNCICHENVTQSAENGGKMRQMTTNEGESRLREFAQLAEFVRLATPLARFGNVVRTASKQSVACSNHAGRAISNPWLSLQCHPQILFAFPINLHSMELPGNVDRFQS
jgi:hypothetical protein